MARGNGTAERGGFMAAAVCCAALAFTTTTLISPVAAAGEQNMQDYNAVIEEHREEVKRALELYMEKHGDEWPETSEGLEPFFADKELFKKVGPAFGGSRNAARKSNMRASLHGLSHALEFYAHEHDGAYPPDLAAVEKAGYLDEDDSVEARAWKGHTVRYRVPQTEDPYEAMLYYWPPFQRGTALLYRNQHVDWVPVEPDGSLVNPLTGDAILTASGAQPSAADDALRAQRVAVREAIAGYLKDHQDQLPAAKADLTHYLIDAGMLGTIDEKQLKSLSYARKKANKHARGEMLFRLGRALRAYRREHDHAYPAQIDEAFAKQYLDGLESIIWPGFELVYAPPAGPGGSETVAYYWPLLDGGTGMLYQDGGHGWLEADEDGNLVNPRTRKTVRQVMAPPEEEER